jgi:serine/threonine-protein kinase
MALNPQVLDLLLRWEERCERGEMLSPEELCRDCPELLPEVRQRIRELQAVPPPSTRDAVGDDARRAGPGASEGADGPDRLGPYRVLRLLGHGGMGEVYVADDADLRRQVAVKRLRPSGAGHADGRRRFLREAEITGGLEHPGVVPVYGLTRDADGRPSYAMRLVKGQTLQEAIRRLHDPGAARADPGPPGLLLRQLLNRFVAVCNTMAYAHSKGVIHRDLKPANILLGDYGETLVIDWGVAKRLTPCGTEDGGPAPGACPPGPGAGGGETAAGEVLGTPAYMSPEQAAGRGPEVGPASDIYSLGATLYTLLTNRTPLPEGGAGPVGAGPFPRPCQVNPAAPRALEAVCLKAMAAAPERRYATALELAEDVERWLADEPVRAYREPLRQRAGRWARRHQAALGAAAVAALMAVVLGGLGAWWLDRQQTERRRGVEGALAEVGRLQGQARWTEARAVLRQAQDRLGDGGPADLRRRLAEARADLEMVVRLDELRQRRASAVETDDFISPGPHVEAFRKAFRDRGLAVDGEGARLLEQVQASAIKEELVAALDEWAWFTPDAEEQARLLAVARRADPHPWRDRWRDQAVRKDGRALKQLAADAPLSELSPFLLVTFAAALGRTGGDQEGLLRQAQQIYPADFWINFDLAWILSNRRAQGEAARAALDEAIGCYRVALAARPQSSLAWTNLGLALSSQGKLTDAEAAARKAIRVQGDNALAHLNLSWNLNRQGRYAEAEAVCQDFIERVRPDYHRIYFNLSVALENLGDLKGAKVACDRAISLARSYAPAWSRRGSVWFQQGNYTEAERDFREAFRLDPGLAEALTGVTDCLRRRRKFAEAEAFCRDVLRVRPEFAPAYWVLAVILIVQGKPADAEAECRKAIGRWPDYASAYSGLGVALYEQQRLSEALVAHRKAFSLAPRDRDVLVNFAASLREEGALDEAEARCREAIRIAPRAAPAYFHLGLIQLRQAMVGPARLRPQMLSRAESSFRKAIELEPDRGHNRVRLGDALKEQGQFTAALEAYRHGDRLGRGEPHWADYLKARIPEAERLVAVEARLASGPKEEGGPPGLDPLLVAQVHVYKRHYTAAARAFARAFTAEPKVAEEGGNGHRYNAACCAALAGFGQGEDAARLDDAERAGWRRQALDWLRGDLKQWTKQLADAAPRERDNVRQALRHWQVDADLAPVRDAEALAQLPDAQRPAWQQLWADVDAVLRKVSPVSDP